MGVRSPLLQLQHKGRSRSDSKQSQTPYWMHWHAMLDQNLRTY